MEEQNTTAMNYAILIGINFYPGRPLKGCVRDIQEIKKCLEEITNVKHIRMLTASRPDEPNPSRPLEDPEFWPTYDNVVSSIKNVTSLAKPGDFVYIHFSGHGTSCPLPSEFSNTSAGTLALVLLNEASSTRTRYLRGLELTQLLSQMVDKKLTVTLVLDCCQSGGVMRNDSSIRFLDYDPLVDAAYPPCPEHHLVPTYRHVTASFDWLRNPDGYMVIAASGPHEIAQEHDFDRNGQYRGALSYFLLKAWKESGGPSVKQRLIYEYLSTRVRNTCRGQNPMRYGDNDQGIFGGALPGINQTSILIVRKPDKGLQLQAGRIHGICDGDQFALYPFGDINPESGSVGDPIIAEVMNFNSPSLEGWETALKARQSLNIFSANQISGQSISFYIAQNSENDYEIRDESLNIIEQPTPMHHEREDMSHILDLIEHIAKFKLVSNRINEALADPSYPFRENFNIKLTNSVGKEFHPGCSQTGWFQPGCSHRECSIEVEDGDRLSLHVENKGDYALYIYVYSLGPFWDIESALRANHAVIPSSPNNSTTRNWKKKLRIEAPDDMKRQTQYHYEEIIKVFLASQLTSFTLLELPELGKSMKKGRPYTTRATRGDSTLPEDWAAVNFRIRVRSREQQTE
ncbi:caspase domain-containing protein [Rutstroemia sp. NJR-2017a WRK4]|nr:caspase domain-containing protein [Rutstroemia sp. NJR-2017a WRK4]